MISDKFCLETRELSRKLLNCCCLGNDLLLAADCSELFLMVLCISVCMGTSQTQLYSTVCWQKVIWASAVENGSTCRRAVDTRNCMSLYSRIYNSLYMYLYIFWIYIRTHRVHFTCMCVCLLCVCLCCILLCPWYLSILSAGCFCFSV